MLDTDKRTASSRARPSAAGDEGRHQSERVAGELWERARAISRAAVSSTSRAEDVFGRGAKLGALLRCFDEDLEQGLGDSAPSRDDVQRVLESILGQGGDLEAQTDVLAEVRAWVKERPKSKRARDQDVSPEEKVLAYFEVVLKSHDEAAEAYTRMAASTRVPPICATELLAMARVNSICSAGHAHPTGLLKLLKYYRYQNQLEIAKSASHCCMIKVHQQANQQREGQAVPNNGPSVFAADLLLSAAYFPQQNDILSEKLGAIVMVLGHEDYVHKCKRATAAVMNPKNDSKDALFDRTFLLEVASSRMPKEHAAEGVALTRVLQGGMGVDIMSFSIMRLVFCSVPFRKAVEAVERERGRAHVQSQALRVFGNYFDSFDRSGLSVARRIEYLQAFNELFDAIVPQSFVDAGYMPQLVGGIPASVWLAMRRNSDSRIFLNALYPWHICVERYFGTFDLECGFSELVRAAGQYKPDAASALDIMDSIDFLASILLQSDKERGFYKPAPRRGAQSQYQGAEEGDAPIYTGRVRSWVLETDADNLPTQRGETRKINHGITQYALRARDFLKARGAQFASAAAPA